MKSSQNGFPPSSKRRRIDLTESQQSVFSINSNTNLNVSPSINNKNWNCDVMNINNNSTTIKQYKITGIMETREILEHIHSFLDLEEILRSTLICKLWNSIFKIRIDVSQLSINKYSGKHECNLFPLYMREMFEKSIGKFEQWLLFFICEYKNYQFKLNLNLSSSLIYPHYSLYNIHFDNLWHSQYPLSTRFNLISNNNKQYKLYEKLLTIFMFQRHKLCNISLHNILFSWLRGLKSLSLYWLNKYDTNNLIKDLKEFHMTLSSDYIEPENTSIPLLKSIHLTKFDYLSSFLGLITINGDFKLFYKLSEKIQIDAIKNKNKNTLFTLFPKQHHPNHVYQHLHTFGFGYNVYGLCNLNLIDLTLKLCDIPRSVCSLKIIRFIIQPHLLVNIQSDLILNKYLSGNILSVSLNKRIVTIKKMNYYFDLCATIHASNISRANYNDYLIYTQLKRPFISDNNNNNNHNNNHTPLIHNYQFWKRYIILCHLVYFIKKYNNGYFDEYLQELFLEKPIEINDFHWKQIRKLQKTVTIIYPKLNDMLYPENEGNIKTKTEGNGENNDNNKNNKSNNNKNNKENKSGYCLKLEKYLKCQYDHYRTSVILLDVIGAIYSNEENRNLLRQIERLGPTNHDQYQTFKSCILSSHDIRHFFVNKYDLDVLYAAIKNVSFHDSDANINDDKFHNDPNDIGIHLKHGAPSTLM